MLQAEFNIEKKRIARSFSQAAKSYDSHAALQRKVADNLLAQLSKNAHVQRVLDLGSGTGYCTKALHRLYPNAEIINLDIAEAMLSFASNKQEGDSFKGDSVKAKSICADAEALPFIENSFDIIFSSLSIQWCQDYAILFSELKRILRPQGTFHISTFGPETLQEVTQAWQQVDSYIHVNRFQSCSFLKNEINGKGFSNNHIKIDPMLIYYQSFEKLARELKSIGASNKNAGQGQGLSGRRKISKLKQAFERNADEELGIPVTYQVFYVSAQS
ncbi:malonyl-ACP O-methyltransferase BioC [Haliea sp. AH-315-K21]|uniref:Malonyl-[acyl-carrier protein] O-methyltransferase n=1 Tax=SAR86 cluster bacterium TaxID=2030880 RepID=A0A2A5CIR7_9GAMM|nr:malonyl-ACP O-methyltransferase BioC [Haliea sp. AH-315-K21]MBN4059705.1 malonyl-ACP O-methyltransferase BioC [bacterium AH-315-I11]MBN4075232.1 malonyl-ACP O-methyltransferase BioC [Gammaproteobacteria bacterium AH-315-E17]PCJ43769.1 MAG: malonyl-[acyl-carrier protein] O-methyltransferase BioC [SAR86 cluster bacterium]